MSRRIRATILLVLVSFALGTTACASATGPRSDCIPGQSTGSDTCP